MRVAVTGASGFVGGVVVGHLLAAGHDVVALSRRPVPERPGTRAPAVGPRDRRSCGRPDRRRRRARRGPRRRVVPVVRAHVAVTVRGTEAVLDTWPTARVVLISSASVYPLRGAGRPKWILTEDDAPTRRPLSSYSRAKIAQEEIVLARGEHRRAATARGPRPRGHDPAAPSGPRSSPGPPRLPRRTAHAHPPHRRATGGSRGRQSVRDRLAAPSILNVADERPLELREIVAGLCGGQRVARATALHRSSGGMGGGARPGGRTPAS